MLKKNTFLQWSHNFSLASIGKVNIRPKFCLRFLITIAVEDLIETVSYQGCQMCGNAGDGIDIFALS